MGSPLDPTSPPEEQRVRKEGLDDAVAFIESNTVDPINQIREILRLPLAQNPEFFQDLAELIKGGNQEVIHDLHGYLNARPAVEELIIPQRRTDQIPKLVDIRQRIRDERDDQEWNFTALDLAFVLTATFGNSKVIDQIVGHSTKFVDVTQTLCRLACPQLPTKIQKKRKASEMENEGLSGLDTESSTEQEITKFIRISGFAETVKRRDGYRCNVLGTAEPEAAHIFPLASNAKEEHLAQISQSFLAMLFFQDERTAYLLSLMTSVTKCLDIPANMLCLNHTLHRLMEQGYIALWWKEAVPEVEPNTTLDFPFKDEPALDVPSWSHSQGEYARYFTYSAIWIVSVQIQFQHRRGKDVTREVDIVGTGEQIFPASNDRRPYSGTRIDPFQIFSECRLSSGRRLEDGHIFTMRIPYPQLRAMKILMQLQWYCITAFTMAGGAGLPRQDWEDNAADDASDCSGLASSDIEDDSS